MRVFLLHGMARTAASMAILSRRLEARGHETTLFGYHVTVQSLDDIAEHLIEKVEGAAEGQPYAVVAHSLGNVITRLAGPRLPAGFARFVMLAPPNRPPLAARRLQGNPLFRVLTRDAGRKLADEDFFAHLPPPVAPTLVITGTGGPKARWLPFEGEVNDGILLRDETRLEGCKRLEVPGLHTFLMNRRDVFDAVVDFLESYKA